MDFIANANFKYLSRQFDCWALFKQFLPKVKCNIHAMRNKVLIGIQQIAGDK